MAHAHGALVVFGSGPGVGLGIATLFAERGFEKIILMSRNGERLTQDAEVVRSARPEATVFEITVDAADIEQVGDRLKNVKESLADTPLECVLFNAARTAKSEFFDFAPSALENDLRIAIVSLYTVAQWAMPLLLQTARTSTSTPSLLVTSGMLAKDPFPGMFSLATCKAGQYSLLHSLHKQYEPQGVHCSMIFIGGTVAKDSKLTNPRIIAEEAWKLFNRPQKQGHLETTIMDPAYEEHTKNREK